MSKRTRASRSYADQRAEFMTLATDQLAALSAILKDLQDGRGPPTQEEFLSCVARSRRMMELIEGGHGELSMFMNSLIEGGPVSA